MTPGTPGVPLFDMCHPLDCPYAFCRHLVEAGHPDSPVEIRIYNKIFIRFHSIYWAALLTPAEEGKVPRLKPYTLKAGDWPRGPRLRALLDARDARRAALQESLTP